MAVYALLIFFLAIVCTMLSIALLKPISGSIGLLDHPDQRKDHIGAIPLIGGIAIWISFTICLLIVGITTKLVVLLMSGGILVVVGAVDDVKDLPPQLRLALHIFAALVMSVVGGVVVQSLGDLIVPGVTLTLGIFAVPFTVFAVVALINATNMSDGLDGLCGLQLVIPLGGLAILSGVKGDQDHFLPLVIICGCLVFLIDMSQGDDAVLQPVAVLWFALLLIYDTVEVVARRLLRGGSPFAADKEHLHHVFLLARFSVTETVLTLGGFTLIGVIVGIATTAVQISDSALFATFILFGLLFLRWILAICAQQLQLCRR
jgi:UDP-GlcNAc:undecaprenyl-phosphate GlcNAc-1-phosphate transferase